MILNESVDWLIFYFFYVLILIIKWKLLKRFQIGDNTYSLKKNIYKVEQKQNLNRNQQI